MDGGRQGDGAAVATTATDGELALLAARRRQEPGCGLHGKGKLRQWRHPPELVMGDQPHLIVPIDIHPLYRFDLNGQDKRLYILGRAALQRVAAIKPSDGPNGAVGGNGLEWGTPCIGWPMLLGGVRSYQRIPSKT